MDYKSVKEPICINETVWKKSAEVPFDTEFTLPDYCRDIMKILKCNVTPRIYSKSINGNSVTADGNITLNVMYCDSENCIYNYEQILPFSKTFEAEFDITSGFVCAFVNNEYVNCRAVNERRIDIHGALNVNVNVLMRKKYEIITEIEEKEIQTDREEITLLNSMGIAEKSLIMDEDLKISDGAEPIETVLNYDAYPRITEIKPVKNKIIVKGNLTVEIMYCSKQHKKYNTYKTVIPFSQFLDIEGANENCRIEAMCELSYLEVRTKKSSDECREFLLNAKICVLTKAFCDISLPVICDAFSVKNEVELERAELNTENLIKNMNENFMFKTAFDFPNGSLNDIISYWTNTQILSAKYDNSKISICGNIILCVIANDASGNISYFEKNESFEYSQNSDFENFSDILCETEFETVSASYTLLSDCRLEFKSEYKVNIRLKETKKSQLLTGFCINSVASKETPKNSMVMYYPFENERLWDIAKRYNSDMEEVKKINGIEDGPITKGKVLLIPIY